MGGGGGGGAGGYAQMATGAIGGILGGVGDIISAAKHKKLKFPKATAAEKHYRKRTRKQMDQASALLSQGIGYGQQFTPEMLSALGYDFDVTQSPAAAMSMQELNDRLAANDKLIQMQADLKGMKKGPGKKAAKKALKDYKKELKGMPSLDDLRMAAERNEQNPFSVGNIRKKAPTIEDTLNQQFQDVVSQRALAAAQGNPEFDPFLSAQFREDEGNLQETMRRNLGEDWATSSAGIEAVTKFGQRKQDTLRRAQQEATHALRNLQLGGAQSLQDLTGGKFELLNFLPQQRQGWSGALQDLGNAGAQAQSPYQFDRSGEFSAAGGNFQYGDPWGHAASQSGDRYIESAKSMS